jgi:hypothetical protein
MKKATDALVRHGEERSSPAPESVPVRGDDRTSGPGRNRPAQVVCVGAGSWDWAQVRRFADDETLATQ